MELLSGLFAHFSPNNRAKLSKILKAVGWLRTKEWAAKYMGRAWLKDMILLHKHLVHCSGEALES